MMKKVGKMDIERKESNKFELPRWVLSLGSMLIIIGTFTGLFVAREALRVYQHLEKNAFVNYLTNQFKDTTLFIFNDAPFVVTTQGASIIAYVSFIVLAFLGINVAAAFIRAGAQIVSPSFHHHFNRLRQQIDKLKSKVRSK